MHGVAAPSIFPGEKKRRRPSDRTSPTALVGHIEGVPLVIGLAVRSDAGWIVQRWTRAKPLPRSMGMGFRWEPSIERPCLVRRLRDARELLHAWGSTKVTTYSGPLDAAAPGGAA